LGLKIFNILGWGFGVGGIGWGKEQRANEAMTKEQSEKGTHQKGEMARLLGH